jgi:uncharacterized protein
MLWVVDVLKWSLQQLYRLGKQKFNFSGEYDFHDRIEDIDDILDISIVSVEGVGQNINEDRYMFQLHITCNMVLECARTLEPVDFPIDMVVVEIYDTVDDGEVNFIDKNTVDLEDAVWENIYLEKPMRIFKEGTTRYTDDAHELESFLNDQENDK